MFQKLLSGAVMQPHSHTPAHHTWTKADSAISGRFREFSSSISSSHQFLDAQRCSQGIDYRSRHGERGKRKSNTFLSRVGWRLRFCLCFAFVLLVKNSRCRFNHTFATRCVGQHGISGLQYPSDRLDHSQRIIFVQRTKMC